MYLTPNTNIINVIKYLSLNFSPVLNWLSLYVSVIFLLWCVRTLFCPVRDWTSGGLSQWGDGFKMTVCIDRVFGQMMLWKTSSVSLYVLTVSVLNIFSLLNHTELYSHDDDDGHHVCNIELHSEKYLKIKAWTQEYRVQLKDAHYLDFNVLDQDNTACVQTLTWAACASMFSSVHTLLVKCIDVMSDRYLSLCW